MTTATQPLPQPAARWTPAHFGYRANALMLYIGVRFLPLAYVLIWFAALYFFLFAPKVRQASMQFLDRIHKKPRPLLTRCCQTYRHLIQFGLLLLDKALMLHSPNHHFTMTGHGIPHLRAALAQNQGLLLLTAHFGNAEAAAPYMSKMGITRPIHLVMYQNHNDSTEKFHTHARRMLAHMNIISTTDPLAAGLKIIAALQQNEVVAIRADRSLDGRTVPASILDSPVHLPAGPFTAAALTNAPLLHIYTCRLGYRQYACYISPPHNYGAPSDESREQRIQRAANDYAATLETILRQHPLQWSNFYNFWQVI